MEHIQPFYIPLGPAGIGAVTQIPPATDAPATIELQVVVGGPVFMFEGTPEVADAYSRSHDAGRLAFDLAAAPGGSFCKSIEGAPGRLTLHSDVESIGYIRWIVTEGRRHA